MSTSSAITPATIVTAAIFSAAIAAAPTHAAERGSIEFRAAAVLSKHCLECHDSAAEAGDLDLSRQASALRGGQGGPALVPGDPDASLLWEYVESDEMPPDAYPRMSDDEKAILLDWLSGDAAWAAKVIDPAEFNLDDTPPPVWLRRLTVPQYVRSVKALTGADVAAEAEQWLPPEHRADGFTNTAYNLDVDLAHVEGFARLAETVTQRINLPAFLARHGVSRDRSDDAVNQTIDSMALEFYRGPAEPHERKLLRSVFDAAVEEGGDHQAGYRFVVQTLLQSPRFLFLIEAAAPGDGPEPVSDLELATRLSFAAWGQTPDRELLDDAVAGRLSEPARLQAHIQRLLRDPRAEDHSTEFVGNWIDLGRLRNLRPHPKKFPDWDAELARDMRVETEAFFRDVAWQQNRPLSDLMNAQVTYLTPRLAQHYDIPWNVEPELATPRGRHLLALYTFDPLPAASSEAGSSEKANSEEDSSKPEDRIAALDRVPSSDPIDLIADDPERVEQTPDGLRLKSEVTVRPAGDAKRLSLAIRESGEFTVEAWVRPKSRGQRGPARVVSISNGSVDRNFTIGQDGDRYVVRYRSTDRDRNGMPEIKAAHGAVELRWTHLAFTRDRDGNARFYVNGEEAAHDQSGGDLSNWEVSYPLLLGNEVGGDRGWLGTYRRVGIYDRALTPDEIRELDRGAVRHDLRQHPARGGVLSQGSLLTIGGDEASMVSRGLFVLNNLLYSRVGNPPPCVDSEPKPSKPGMTQRDLAKVRLSDSSCTGCHTKFEPLAFGLEKFDGVGAYHDVDEHGNELRHDGEILFPGDDKPTPFASSAELMELMAESERVRKGITRKLVQFVIARPLVPADTDTLNRIHDRGRAHGGTYAALMSEILSSDLVRNKYPETAE